MMPSRLSPLATIALAATALALALTTTVPAHAQNQPAAADWYDQQKVDSWARHLVSLLNAGDIDEASQFVPFDGIYEVAIVDLVRKKIDDPEVLAYLKEFFPIFKSVLTPQGGDKGSTDFLKSGVDSGKAYILLRVLPKGQSRAPELNYLQVGIAPAPDSSGYVIEDVFILRSDKSLNTVCRTLFLAMMPDSVFEKVGQWSDEHASIHKQGADIMAIMKQAGSGDAACIDSFLALDPPRPHDLVLLETCSTAVFENSNDPGQIKKVIKAWQVGRPKGICNVIWNTCGMRRLGSEGYDQANKGLDVMRGIEMFANDGYLDVLSADHSMRSNKPEIAEQHARNAVAKEPDLFIGRHVLHLILARKDDFEGIAKSMRELAQLDSAFTLKYLQDTAQLEAFRSSDAGKALLTDLQK